MINEDAKVQIIYKTTEEGTYQFNIEIKDRLHVDLVEMYEASKSCSYTKNIKINESSEVLRYVEKNSHQNIQLDLDENVDVYKYARVSCAYVELTDYTTLSKIKYRLLEEEASVKLRLASLSKEKENKHYEMTLEHLAPHTYGDMDNYGIVKSKASLIIDGVGRIYKGMSGSDTHQTNKIIVFDEATSSLDNNTEFKIQQNIDKYFNNQTIICIAHRLSTLKDMDKIVVINDGKIIEIGTPKDDFIEC